MILDIRDLTPEAVDAAGEHFAAQGYVRLTGLGDSITPRFRDILSRQLGVPASDMESFIQAEGAPFDLNREQRAAVSRIETGPELAGELLDRLGPMLERLTGPLLHVSSTFHGQFKGGDATGVKMGGGIDDHMEVQRPYLLHQDFAGARIPTSPAGVTFWLGINTTPDWKLRLYPGTHRLGLLCHEWMELTDERLASFGEPLEIPATAGDAVLFNALLLHGTGEQGPCRRVSCDIRFFPLCGWLPSTVHQTTATPLDSLKRGLEARRPPTLAAPVMEIAAYLGIDGAPESADERSILNWAAYVRALMEGRTDGAESHIANFVNDELGIDPPSAYIGKFHGRPFEQQTIEQARAMVSTVQQTDA